MSNRVDEILETLTDQELEELLEKIAIRANRERAKRNEELEKESKSLGLMSNLYKK